MHRFHHRLRVIKWISTLLSCLILAFLAFYVIQKKENILIGLAHIITSPAILITDFILVGGIGAAFLNALLIFIFNFNSTVKFLNLTEVKDSVPQSYQPHFKCL